MYIIKKISSDKEEANENLANNAEEDYQGKNLEKEMIFKPQNEQKNSYASVRK